MCIKLIKAYGTNKSNYQEQISHLKNLMLVFFFNCWIKTLYDSFLPIAEYSLKVLYVFSISILNITHIKIG